MTKLAIGFKIYSSTSARQKQYTAVVLDDGHFIKNWGNRSTNGTVRVHKMSNATRAVNELRTLYMDKSRNREYDTIEILFQSVPVTYQLTKGTLTESESNRILKMFKDSSPTYRGQETPAGVSAYQGEVAKTIQEFLKGTASAGAKVAPQATTAPVATVEPPKDKFFTKVENKLVRPNGEQYRPREIMGHTDVALLREFKDRGIFVRLAGPPGAGKTALAEASFPEIVTVNGHGDMTVAHFVGSYLPDPANGNSWVWHDGPLVRAMKEGKVLFVDEGTRIPTEVINILFSVMDGRGVLNIDDRPDLPQVNAKDGFYVIMGYNPETLGARALDEALISRFRVEIEVYTDFDTAKLIGVPQVALRIARNLQTQDERDRQSGGPGIWVPQMRELITYRDLIKMKVGDDFALATLVASCPRTQDIPILIDTIKKVAKKTVSKPTLGKMV